MVACDVEPIIKTFKITGLDSVFTLAPSVDAALERRALEAA